MAVPERTPGGLSFPDGPRLELDQALATLLTHVERVIVAQGRLRALLTATQAVAEGLDLPRVLSRITETATELVNAEYGALGVISPEGDQLDEFVVAGLSDEEVKRIGRLPSGHGLLGALIADPRPIRLPQMADDPRASGFPPHHPRMESFLGVPIRIRGQVYGNLYMTNRRDGLFTDEDEQLLAALAVSAGIAIGNARLHGETQTRARWMTAAEELSAALLSSPTDTAFDLLATRALDVADAASAAVLLIGADDAALRVAGVRGVDEETLLGASLDPSRVCAGPVLRDAAPLSRPRETCDEPDPLRVRSGDVDGPVMAVPLRTSSRFWGVLCVARDPDARRFTSTELESATDLASRASIALELSHAREERQRSLLVDDRARIARDLHDHVIQQLFGTGLSLQAVASGMPAGAQSERIDDAVGQIDDAISQIRTVVFALSQRDESSLRHRVLDVVGQLSASLTRPPAIRFTGPVDHVIVEDLSDEVVGVARELLSNAVRHAEASRISVEVAALDGWITVHVEDDGTGLDPDAPRSGLANLTTRARRRGGELTLGSSDAGTSALWRVPSSRDGGGG